MNEITQKSNDIKTNKKSNRSRVHRSRTRFKLPVKHSQVKSQLFPSVTSLRGCPENVFLQNPILFWWRGSVGRCGQTKHIHGIRSTLLHHWEKTTLREDVRPTSQLVFARRVLGWRTCADSLWHHHLCWLVPPAEGGRRRAPEPKRFSPQSYKSWRPGAVRLLLWLVNLEARAGLSCWPDMSKKKKKQTYIPAVFFVFIRPRLRRKSCQRWWGTQMFFLVKRSKKEGSTKRFHAQNKTSMFSKLNQSN